LNEICIYVILANFLLVLAVIILTQLFRTKPLLLLHFDWLPVNHFLNPIDILRLLINFGIDIFYFILQLLYLALLFINNECMHLLLLFLVLNYGLHLLVFWQQLLIIRFYLCDFILQLLASRLELLVCLVNINFGDDLLCW